MLKLREELNRLHDEEKFKEEKELEAASKRQKAINDLERGVRDDNRIHLNLKVYARTGIERFYIDLKKFMIFS